MGVVSELEEYANRDSCDFCYTGEVNWDAKFKYRGFPQAEWDFKVCDLCRRMLRDIIGPILHKVTHGQLLQGIQALMQELDIGYDDLMTFGIQEKQKGIEDA